MSNEVFLNKALEEAKEMFVGKDPDEAAARIILLITQIQEDAFAAGMKIGVRNSLNAVGYDGENFVNLMPDHVFKMETYATRQGDSNGAVEGS